MSKTETIGIAIDKWKLPIFKRNLDRAGFTFTEHPGLTPDMLLLKVVTNNRLSITRCVESAQTECRKKRSH